MKLRNNRSLAIISAAIMLLLLGSAPAPDHHQSSAVASILRLPPSMRIPDDVGAQMSQPRLSVCGDPLVVSNSPEIIKTTSGAAGLYRTCISGGKFRVFFHHQNMNSRPMKIGLAITCPAAQADDIEVYMARNSQMIPRSSASTAHADPATAGKTALRNWFRSRSNPNEYRYFSTLAPGRTRYILQSVAPGATLTGMYDLAAKYAGKSDKIPQVIVTTLICDNPPSDPCTLQVLPPDAGEWYRRGTFPHSDRDGVIECDTSQIKWVDLAGPHTGKYSRLMANEMEKAMDDPKAWNPGNYGVIYHLRMSVRNSTPGKLFARCLLDAAGGPGYSGVTVNGVFKESGRMLAAYESWVIHKFTLGPDQLAKFSIDFSLPGGSSGAHRLLLWPERPGSEAASYVIQPTGKGEWISVQPKQSTLTFSLTD